MKNLLLISIFCVISILGFSQTPTMPARFDGHYSPCEVDNTDPDNPVYTGEYADASHVHFTPGSSSTCDIFDIFFETYKENNDYFLVLGTSHGNGGAALFRFYFNTDCNATTGQQMAHEDDSNANSPEHPVGGADFRVDMSANGSGGIIYKWDTTLTPDAGWTDVTSNFMLGAMAGDFTCDINGGSFLEMWLPITDLVNSCNYDSTCGKIELTAALSNSGNSTSSQFCNSVSASIEIPYNSPPKSDFTITANCFESPINELINIGNSAFTIPTMFDLEVTEFSDPDISGSLTESLNYSWSMHFGSDINNLTRSNSSHGVFSNPSGTNMLTATPSSLNTTYTITDLPTFIASMPVTLVFQLEVTDHTGCASKTSDFDFATLNYTYVLDVTDETSLCRIPITAISISTFEADFINESQVQLSWNTVSEFNNEKFVVERKSIFENDFYEIGEVEGAGTSSGINEYKFIDNTNSSSNNYRLKMVDYDGNVTYSNSINLQREITNNEIKVINAPNEFVVNFILKDATPVQSIQVTNTQGRVVDYFVPDHLQSNHSKFAQFYIPNGSYGRELYFITVNFGDGTRKTIKAMKLQ